MSQDPQLQPPRGGWTFLKVIGLLAGLFGILGFGLLTVCGVLLKMSGYGEGVEPYIIGGVLLTIACLWGVVAIIRAARRRPPDRQP